MTTYASGKCGNEYFVVGAIQTFIVWRINATGVAERCSGRCTEGNGWSNSLMLGHFVFKNIRMFLRTN